MNDKKEAKKFLEQMYAEYINGKDLIHKGIVQYMYFQRQEIKEFTHLSIIMEYMQGGDMANFIKAK